MESKSIKNRCRKLIEILIDFLAPKRPAQKIPEGIGRTGNLAGGGAGGRGVAPPRYLTFGKYQRFEEFEELEYLQ